MANNKRQSERKPGRDGLFNEILALATSAGIPPADFAAHFRKSLKSMPDQDRALTNYLRFVQAGFTTSLMRDFHGHPVLEEIFLQLAAQSQYLTDILVRTPELLHWLTASGVLMKARSREEYLKDAGAAIAPFERSERRLNALKRFQRRELLRLGAQEILGEASGEAVAAELAGLADAVIDTVLRVALDDLRNRLGGDIPSELCIIGLGKLGGEELNFSSDVDLMFVYEKDEDLPPRIGGMHTAHQLYARLAESTVRMLSEHTGEGYFYRVDLRLRPDGQAGPLAMSRAAFMTYYESRGEVWERQMLLKARPVAGDMDVGSRFLNDVRPFMYPRAHLRSPLEEIAAVKRKIEEKVGAVENIKLGAGGIRDIEFIVQGMMLVHGGGNPQLRVRGTLPALDRLRESGHLSAPEQKRLRDAYVFLRAVEHRLQLLEGRQTHSLPETAHEMAMLSKRLGFANASAFRTALDRHRSSVRRSFARTFGAKTDARSSSVRVRGVDSLRTFAEDAGLRARPDLIGRLASLRKAVPALWESPARGKFLRAFRSVRGTEVALMRFAHFADADAIRRTLSAALPNGRFMDLFLKVCGTSGYVSRVLVDEPLLFETMAGRPEEMLGEAFGWNFLREADPYRFKLYNEARILLRYLAGIIPLDRLFNELSALAEHMIVGALAESNRSSATDRETDGPVLIALGKLGGQELTVGSDLDLLFLIEESTDAARTRADAVARRFLGIVAGGNPPIYRLDLRLRPEGKSAPVVSSIAYFRDYFHGRAQLWERQSLLRRRILAGSVQQQRSTERLLAAIAFDVPLPEGWVEELWRMRERIEKDRGKQKKEIVDLKTTAGGLLDIEFIVQALQLCHGARNSALQTPSVIHALRALTASRAIPKPQAKALTANYEWLRTLELFIKMNSTKPEFTWPVSDETAVMLASAMDEHSPGALARHLRTVLKQNRAILHATFKSLRK